MNHKDVLKEFRDEIYGENDALFDREGNNVSRQVENIFIQKLQQTEERCMGAFYDAGYSDALEDMGENGKELKKKTEKETEERLRHDYEILMETVKQQAEKETIERVEREIKKLKSDIRSSNTWCVGCEKLAHNIIKRISTKEKEKLELICERCDRDYPCWFVSNNTWNEVIRDEVSGDSFQFLCPTCFVVIAAMQGITPIWFLDKEHQDIINQIKK